MARTLAILAVLLLGAPAAQAATAVDAPTKVVDVGKGQKVAYRSFGEGPPLVLIMGLSGTMGAWDPAFLDAVARSGHRVVILDNEGVGRSSALPGKLSIRRMGDTTARLIDALDLKRADLAGWSMGGMIAQSVAVRHPDSVRRLVLLATAPGDGQATPPDTQALSDLARADPGALAVRLFPPDRSADRAGYLKRISMREPFEGLAPKPVVDRQLFASGMWLAGNDPDGKRVSRFPRGVLVAGGEQDALLPVANQRHLAATIPGAKLVTYPDASHGFMFQKAKRFLPQLARFLR